MRRLIAIALLLVATPLSAMRLRIAPDCYQYIRSVESAAWDMFGVNAPVALFMAQLQQESACNATAHSGVGANGLAQFMPSTAKWLAQKYKRTLWPPDEGNPDWAIKAQVQYMHDLVPNRWATGCDWWAAKLSSYNGGEGWLHRDQGVCRRTIIDYCAPCYELRWWGNVEITPDTRRSRANISQNRDYVRRIMLGIMAVH